MKLSSVFLLLLSSFLTSCSSSSQAPVIEQPNIAMQANTYYEHKLSDLINKLTQVKQFHYQQEPVAFTTLVWIDTLTSKNNQREDTQLGHQFSSGLKTKLVQRGGKVVEHKSATAISMSNDASYYLTRNLNELTPNIDVSYVLTGTMLDVKGGVELNIEVIDVETHIVVSTARTFFPNEFLPKLNNAFAKEGKIYREQL